MKCCMKINRLSYRKWEFFKPSSFRFFSKLIKITLASLLKPLLEKKNIAPTADEDKQRKKFMNEFFFSFYEWTLMTSRDEIFVKSNAV